MMKHRNTRRNAYGKESVTLSQQVDHSPTELCGFAQSCALLERTAHASLDSFHYLRVRSLDLDLPLAR